MDGALWRRFIEFAAFDSETIHEYVLLEVKVWCTNLHKDVVHDYGFVSMIEEISLKDVVGVYRLMYPDIDSVDWFYPWIYPAKGNSAEASFKKVTQFVEKE